MDRWWFSRARLARVFARADLHQFKKQGFPTLTKRHFEFNCRSFWCSNRATKYVLTRPKSLQTLFFTEPHGMTDLVASPALVNVFHLPIMRTIRLGASADRSWLCLAFDIQKRSNWIIFVDRVERRVWSDLAFCDAPRRAPPSPERAHVSPIDAVCAHRDL